MFWNVASAREYFTAIMVRWYCAVAHLTGNTGCKNALCWQQCFFSHSIKARGLCYQQPLAAYTSQDACVQQSHATKPYCRNLEVNFEDLLPCYCYATRANSRTKCTQVSQSAFAGKGADLVNCKLITAWYQNSEPVSCGVWVSYR